MALLSQVMPYTMCFNDKNSTFKVEVSRSLSVLWCGATKLAGIVAFELPTHISKLKYIETIFVVNHGTQYSSLCCLLACLLGCINHIKGHRQDCQL